MTSLLWCAPPCWRAAALFSTNWATLQTLCPVHVGSDSKQNIRSETYLSSAILITDWPRAFYFYAYSWQCRGNGGAFLSTRKKSTCGIVHMENAWWNGLWAVTKHCTLDKKPLEIPQSHPNPASFAPPGTIKGDFNNLCYAYNALVMIDIKRNNVDGVPCSRMHRHSPPRLWIKWQFWDH